MLTLRPYQEEAVEAFFEYVSQGEYSGVISMSTGSGKSLVIAEVCRRIITSSPHVKILVCAHRYELLTQNRNELTKHCREIETGIYSAGLNSYDTSSQVIFCGIQSVANHGYDFGKVDVLIIDECHKVNSEEGTSYAKFIHDLKIVNPNLVILGLSATPYRLDSGVLYGDTSDCLFKSLYHEVDLMGLIRDGYLCPVISKGSAKKIDLSEVRTTAGDYNLKDLAMATDNTVLTRQACDEIVQYGADRKAWVVFATSIMHANNICDELTSRGVVAHVITSESPMEERKQSLTKFKEGQLRCIVNCGVLTEGWNAPITDMVVLVSATTSPGKFLQMVGRGMRIYEGKKDCMLLDFGKNVERHGLLDDIHAPSKKAKGDGDGGAPAKECPRCHTYMHTRARTCPECGFEMPPPILNTPTAYEGAVLSTQEEPIWAVVDGVNYSRHKGRDGKKDTLRCDFMTDIQYNPISLWLCVEHTGYAKKKADMYIRAVGGVANTIDDALKECVRWADPTKIKVQKDGKFWKVLSFDIPEDAKVVTFQDRINSILS